MLFKNLLVWVSFGLSIVFSNIYAGVGSQSLSDEVHGMLYEYLRFEMLVVVAFLMVGILVWAIQINRQKHALQVSEAQFRNAFAHSPIGMALVGIDGAFINVNQSFIEFFGYTREELLSSQLQLMVAPEDVPACLESMQGLLLNKSVSYQVERRCIHKQGCWVWGLISMTLQRDCRDNPLHFVLQIVNIDKIKQTELALRESEQRLRQVGDNLPKGAIYQLVHHLDGAVSFPYVSAGIERLFGLKVEDVISNALSLHSLIHPDDVVRVREAEVFSKQSLTAFDCEFRQYHQGGELRWVHCRSKPRLLPSGEVVWDGIVTDITERKRTEEALRTRNSQIQALFNALPDMVFRIKPDGTFIDYHIGDQDMLNILLLHPEFFLGKGFTGLLPPERAAAFADALQCTIQTHDITQVEYVLNLEGHERYYEARIAPSDDEHLVVISRDMTARKLAESQLQSSKKLLRTIIDAVPLWIAFIDNSGKFIIANQRYSEFLSLPLEEIEGAHYAACMPESWLDRHTPWINACYEGGEKVHFEDTYQALNGQIFYMDGMYIPMRDSSEKMTGIVTFVIDNTELRQSELKIKQYAEQLKTLNATKDKFFSIIAHDLRNPFASLVGASELLMRNAPRYDTQRVQEWAKMMNMSAKHGAALLENLLEWARSQTGKLQVCLSEVNLHFTILKELDTVKSQAQVKDITLSINVSRDLMVLADFNLLRTVLRNLLTNAVKYTYAQGTVQVTASVKADVVLVAVSDTGIGMNVEQQGKLFILDEKISRLGTAEETGTGLGLLLCKEFVEKQGGKIWVESYPNRGSIFTFSLRLASASNL